jgi:hypothetical protein
MMDVCRHLGIWLKLRNKRYEIALVAGMLFQKQIILELQKSNARKKPGVLGSGRNIPNEILLFCGSGSLARQDRERR